MFGLGLGMMVMVTWIGWHLRVAGWWRCIAGAVAVGATVAQTTG